MFRNLGLSTKLLLTFVPLFLLLIGDGYYITVKGQEEAMLQQAQNAAFEKAQILRVSLVQQMVENERVDDAYLESLRKVGGLQELYIRIKPENLRLREWLEDSARTERLMKREAYALAKGDIGNEVFASGNALFVRRENDVEAIIPFKAEKKCQTCHDVPIGQVLGAAHIQVPLKEINVAIAENSNRTALISGVLALVTLIVGYFVFRTLVLKPVKILASATEAIAGGNLNYELNAIDNNDEIGTLNQSFDKMRRALKLSQDALRTSTVGQIAQSLIRDFRAPMRQILTSVEQIERTDPSADEKKLLCGTARNSVIDMNKMAQDLLDYTTGDIKVNKRTTNLVNLINYVAESVRSDLDRDVVRLEVESGVTGNVPLDYERFGRALINIIGYASNYVPPGGVIKLATTQEGANVVVTVSDNGSGIPPQFRDRIFEPFTKFVQEKGLGISLALAKRIIDLQGGRIVLESVEGTGSTFTIHMPVAA